MEQTQALPPTISTDELSAILDKPTTKVLDCSVQFGRQAGDCSRLGFLKSHIKGAQYLDLEGLRDQSTELPFMMPKEAQFINHMKALGIRMTDRVVCYDSGGMQFWGYRALWMLQAMGHPQVQVLDGGFQKWTTEGKAVESTDAHAKEEDFGYKYDAAKGQTLEQMQAFDGSEAARSFVLLDARAPDGFAAGHIQGAVNFPVGKLLDANKQLKSQADRKAEFEGAGIDLSKDIACTCMAGVAAAVLYGGLKDIATGKLSMYDGSWAQFSAAKK